MIRVHHICFFIAAILLTASCGNPEKVIRIKGSDTEVNLAVRLAEHFHKENSVFSVAISGGGSGLGIASLLNGQADIANSSRPLTEEEIVLFQKRKMDVRTVIFAEDATAFIVHKTFPFDTIDVVTLAGLLSGAINNWKQITGMTQPVTIYGRQRNSGTHAFVQKRLHCVFSIHAREMNGNAQILESVKMDASGIGYVSAGYIKHNGNPDQSGIKVLRIAAHKDSIALSPLDEAAIKERQYYFQRPLYQFIPARSWNKVQAFIQFEKGSTGKILIDKEGYYNVR